uniref:Uncharacterized protein n=1 Tax=Haplochromis burtoni TaxID=8153 RepID=A0A3Q2X2Y4_HAPBU
SCNYSSLTFHNIEQLYCFLKTEIKTSDCSKEVSLNPITEEEPTLCFFFSPPGFETTEGEVCCHWKQDWVNEKIKELE